MNILLVDDDIASRMTLAKFLSNLGYKVDHAEDGVIALEKMEAKKYHLVICDVRMPIMNGIEFLNQANMRGLTKNVYIIVLTGYATIKDSVEVLKLGAYDYLTKPLNLDEFMITLGKIRDILGLKNEIKELKKNYSKQLKDTQNNYQNEILELKRKLFIESGIGHLGLFSAKIQKLYDTAEIVSKDPSIPILIEGETGTGKEVLARYIHITSSDITSPFIAVNCAAINPHLFESELFGYESGAFTGALNKGQIGKFQLAEKGTILLDEISEIPIELQAKILRVIQERSYYKVGGLKEQNLNARIICTTNRNIKGLVYQNKFREDLYYRLTIGHLIIPPLRDRKEEIVPLAFSFFQEFAEKKNKAFKSINSEAGELLLNHKWEGNVRELRNTIEKVVVLYNDSELKPVHLSSLKSDSQASQSGMLDVALRQIISSRQQINLEELIMDIVRNSLEANDGNKVKTAQKLGLTRDKLYTYLKKL